MLAAFAWLFNYFVMLHFRGYLLIKTQIYKNKKSPKQLAFNDLFFVNSITKNSLTILNFYERTN